MSIPLKINRLNDHNLILTITRHYIFPTKEKYEISFEFYFSFKDIKELIKYSSCLMYFKYKELDKT